jgi:hypothetical protein
MPHRDASTCECGRVTIAGATLINAMFELLLVT